MLYFILLFFYFSPGLSLKESEISKVYDLLGQTELYQKGEFKGEKNVSLHYLKFGNKKGEKGSIVFVNGWGENVFKYIELFYDLYLQGWSPIYTYDHRGQGFSDRLLPHPKASHVETFSHYREDFETFVHLVFSDPKFNQENSFLIAHSMGGAVVIDYLQNHPNQTHFKAVTLSSPLFRVQSRINPFFERGVLGLMKFYCWFACAHPVPDVKPVYSKRKRAGSQARYNFSLFIEKEKFPYISLNRPTYHWIVESFSAFTRIMEEQRVKLIKTPILILQGEKENLVSNNSQDQFCNLIPNFCGIKKIPGHHEHFSEVDEYREQAIQEIVNFFSVY